MSGAEELTAEVVAAIERLFNDRTPVHIELSRWQAFCILGAIQLASRHPGTTKSAAVAQAVEFARLIESTLQDDPMIAAMAAKGWDPSYDA